MAFQRTAAIEAASVVVEMYCELCWFDNAQFEPPLCLPATRYCFKAGPFLNYRARLSLHLLRDANLAVAYSFTEHQYVTFYV